MVDGADPEVDRLEATESALDAGEALVRQHGGGGIEGRGRQGGAQDVEPVERRLGDDGLRVADEAERLLGDGQLEVLGDLAPSQHGADLERNRRLAAERITGAYRRRLDFREIRFGG